MSRVLNGKAASAKQSFSAAAQTTAASSWQLTLYTFSIIFQHLLLPYLDSCKSRSPWITLLLLIIAVPALYLTNANGLPRKKTCITSHLSFKLFENYSKCRIWIFEFWHFPTIFALLKLTCLVTLFDRKLQVFKNSSKWTIFGILIELLSTQNVNVARFARNVEWDFFCSSVYFLAF